MEDSLLRIINQVFEIEKKAIGQNPILRPLERIKTTFLELGYEIHNPMGEKYNETRTDCEASIAGTNLQNLIVTTVIKPIVRREGVIVQKGVVVVEGN